MIMHQCGSRQYSILFCYDKMSLLVDFLAAATKPNLTVTGN